MAIITLITDFGKAYHHISSIKAKLLSYDNTLNIVDIAHTISPFDKIETAYIIQNSYKDYPKGTIHIIGVQSEFHSSNKAIITSYDDQYFISADNGIVSLVFEEKFEENTQFIITDRDAYDFTVKDLFVEVAIKILEGIPLNKLSTKATNLNTANSFKAYFSEDRIKGCVIFIDSYGNCITNIHKTMFDEKKTSEKFEIRLKRQYMTVNRIYKSYSSVNETEFNHKGEPFGLFNCDGFLEIAIFESNPNKYGASSTLLGVKILDEVELILL